MEWQSFGIVVHYVITKGGPDFFVYEYDGMMNEDKNLINPKVGSEGQNMSDLSNFRSCAAKITLWNNMPNLSIKS